MGCCCSSEAAVEQREDVFADECPQWEERELFLTMQSQSRTAEGHMIAYCVWEPTDKAAARGIVCMVHGMHEHIERYQHVAHRLTQRGYFVLGHDHIGHGRSGGEAGLIPDYNILVDDAVQVWSSVVPERFRIPGRPPLPVMVVAHSMGTLVSVLAIQKLRNQQQSADGSGVHVVGALLNGMATQPGPAAASPFGITCCFCITQINCLLHCLGSCTASLDPAGPNAPIDMLAISRDEEVIQRTREDRFHHKFPVKNLTAYQFVLMRDLVLAQTSDFVTPVCITHGSADRICYPEGSRVFYQGAATPAKNKVMRNFTGFFHDLFLDEGRDEFLDYLMQTLDAWSAPESSPEDSAGASTEAVEVNVTAQPTAADVPAADT